MYTILINSDNSVVATKRQRIMQRSKLVDSLRILVPRMYGDYDMKDFTAIMEYQTPISKTYNFDELALSEDGSTSDGFLKYVLKIDTNLTAENGLVNVKFSFINQEMDEEGNVTQHVRHTESIDIQIIPVTDWFNAPDPALATLAQYIVANQQSIKALEDLAVALNSTKADDIVSDAGRGELYVTSNGQKIGTGISLNDLGDDIAEATKKGLVKVIDI